MSLILVSTEMSFIRVSASQRRDVFPHANCGLYLKVSATRAIVGCYYRLRVRKSKVSEAGADVVCRDKD